MFWMRSFNYSWAIPFPLFHRLSSYPELVKIRTEAGVKSPEFIYLDQLEAGTL
jgi:hypothetical protein